jgi:hypothetical protein
VSILCPLYWEKVLAWALRRNIVPIPIENTSKG